MITFSLTLAKQVVKLPAASATALQALLLTYSNTDLVSPLMHGDICTTRVGHVSIETVHVCVLQPLCCGLIVFVLQASSGELCC